MLALVIATVGFLGCLSCEDSSDDLVPFVYVGGVPLPMTTTPRDITIFRLDMETGRLTPAGTATGAAKPSFLAFHPDRQHLYAVDEVTDGKVVSYSIDQKTGALTMLNSASAAGFGPCHISIDRSGKWAFTASWADTMPASIGVLPILPDGKVGEPVDRKDFIPMGYAHFITSTPDNKFVLANLNGEGATAQYAFDSGTGKLTANDPPRTTYPAGYGPRHLDFHPNGRFVYVIHEQGAKITAHSYDATKGTLTQIQEVSTLPAAFAGMNTTAQILVHKSGKFVYGSNRGHDSVVIYKIDASTGQLTFVAHQLMVGARPRNFNFDPSGKLMLVASQDEHNLRVYRVDQDTGMLTALGEPQPVGNRPTFVGVVMLPGK
jgi:6-phosphogluconolactonase